MTDQAERLLKDLVERAKELDCLYRADELLNRFETSPEEVFGQLVQAIPAGWQYPDACRCRLRLPGAVYQGQGFYETPWSLSAPITSHGQVVGDLAVVYTSPCPTADQGPFLKEERRLLQT
ncbi:MAG: hypothetical protein K8I02_01315, partial [Candidatus Methylomirabilis sp.]|nr:hypothetical protein [Deltaproteobacteria bacterium]